MNRFDEKWSKFNLYFLAQKYNENSLKVKNLALFLSTENQVKMIKKSVTSTCVSPKFVKKDQVSGEVVKAEVVHQEDFLSIFYDQKS